MSNVNQNAATVVNNATQQVETPTSSSKLKSLSVSQYKRVFDVMDIDVLRNPKTEKLWCVVTLNSGMQHNIRCQQTLDPSKDVVMLSEDLTDLEAFCLCNPSDKKQGAPSIAKF